VYPNRCVVDANVMIDLHLAGLLRFVSELPFRLLTPDSVAADELRTLDLGAGLSGVETKSLSWEELERAMALYAETYPTLSLYDAHVLVLADSIEAFLLTGDRRLRKKAEEMGLEVHGVLWLLNVMVELGVVRCDDAAMAIDKMLSGGSRLPGSEISRLKAKWGCFE